MTTSRSKYRETCDFCGKGGKKWVFEDGFRLCADCARSQRELRRKETDDGKAEGDTQDCSL